MGTIDYELDRDRQRVLIRFEGDIDGRTLQKAMADLWHAQPQIASYDTVCDMTTFTGDFGFDDIRTLSEAWKLFCSGADRGRRTAVVSQDRFAPMYIKAIALCFSGRHLAVFRSLGEARRWLDRANAKVA